MSNSLQPHGLQQARLPCPSLSPEVCSNSCPLCWWCNKTASSSVNPFSSCPQSFSVSVLPMNIQGWFPLDWLVWSSCHPRDSQECSPAPQFKSISSLVLSLLYDPTLTSIHDYWKNHSFDRAPDLGLIEVTDWGPGIGTSTCPCAGQAWMTDCQGALGAELLCL